MSDPTASTLVKPRGYAPLLWVDPKNGRHNGSETILVPIPLAATLNAARRELYDKRSRAGAWERACVRPQPIVPDAADEDDIDDDPKESVDTLSSIRESMRSQPVVPISAPPPVASIAPRAARKRPAAGGRTVNVISEAVLSERRKSIELRFKFTTEEKKTETKLMDDLRARGETRVVGLTKDWRARLTRLRTDMPHLSKVIDRIEACCALSAFTRQPLRIPPMLLVGPPGVGKTYFATRLADVLGVRQFLYALEAAETVAVLTGSEKHWYSAEPGELYKLIVLGQHANPVVVLDELDKARSGGSQYRPTNALHAVLEPLTARALRDKCMDLTFDASYTVYVATANRLSTIDPSLLSRFELVYIDEPGPRAAVAIARVIAQEVLRDLGLTRRFETPTGEVVLQLALLGSPRRMHKVLTAALGRSVVAGRSQVEVADLLESPDLHLPKGGSDEPIH
jgi:ATP-dependent Lon protease